MSSPRDSVLNYPGCMLQNGYTPFGEYLSVQPYLRFLLSHEGFRPFLECLCRAAIDPERFESPLRTVPDSVRFPYSDRRGNSRSTGGSLSDERCLPAEVRQRLARTIRLRAQGEGNGSARRLAKFRISSIVLEQRSAESMGAIA